MNVKNQIKSLITVAALLFANGAYAGKEGVSLYYGAGLGAMSLDEKSGSISYDTAGMFSVFFGIEEDGWALEYTGLATLETGTEINNIEYQVSGKVLSLGYRSIEKNGRYFLFAYGQTDTDTDIILTTTDTESTFSQDGKTYTVGMGMRVQSGNRMELNYSMYDPEADEPAGDFISKVHMISLRYLFGGSKAPYK